MVPLRQQESQKLWTVARQKVSSQIKWTNALTIMNNWMCGKSIRHAHTSLSLVKSQNCVVILTFSGFSFRFFFQSEFIFSSYFTKTTNILPLISFSLNLVSFACVSFCSFLFLSFILSFHVQFQLKANKEIFLFN